ncbi:uncharacterized protein KY384_004446 [Bacidia gigantensis]|uniref:uncharacterized protein n=1 Tax=Bacidia gigantensis TaxID=2732470 RepID=UPI001D03CACA|nr:uncharacterized protein KY384_004446 [Bacidia gigantensis]KAG8531089.1 hypothetical protein KY384_004446 [Bacidia gigantensis]
MRSPSPTPSPTRQPTALSPSHSSPRSESPETIELRKQVADTMISVLPATRPLRPKLSLQTTLPPASTSNLKLDLVTDAKSPTARSTSASTFDAPPPTPASAIQPRVEFPPTLALPSPSKSRPGQSVSLRCDAPYILALGSRSILRNSPLPKRHLSATSSSRPHKRMFFPTKRVTFKENLTETIPTPVIETSEDEVVEESGTEQEREERRATIETEDGHPNRSAKRSRGRDWIWRPMPEDFPNSPRLDEKGSLAEAPSPQARDYQQSV